MARDYAAVSVGLDTEGGIRVTVDDGDGNVLFSDFGPSFADVLAKQLTDLAAYVRTVEAERTHASARANTSPADNAQVIHPAASSSESNTASMQRNVPHPGN